MDNFPPSTIFLVKRCLLYFDLRQSDDSETTTKHELKKAVLLFTQYPMT